MKVGVDVIDKEINDVFYGDFLFGDDYLVFGYESFGVVEVVGFEVWCVKLGDYVMVIVC